MCNNASLLNPLIIHFLRAKSEVCQNDATRCRLLILVASPVSFWRKQAWRAPPSGNLRVVCYTIHTLSSRLVFNALYCSAAPMIGIGVPTPSIPFFFCCWTVTACCKLKWANKMRECSTSTTLLHSHKKCARAYQFFYPRYSPVYRGLL